MSYNFSYNILQRKFGVSSRIFIKPYFPDLKKWLNFQTSLCFKGNISSFNRIFLYKKRNKLRIFPCKNYGKSSTATIVENTIAYFYFIFVVDILLFSTVFYTEKVLVKSDPFFSKKYYTQRKHNAYQYHF